MAQVIWTEQATEDIRRIAEYIEVESPYYASLIVRRLYNKVEHLRQFPEIGRLVPEIQDTNSES